MENEIALKYGSCEFEGTFEKEQIINQKDGYYRWPNGTEYKGDVKTGGIIRGQGKTWQRNGPERRKHYDDTLYEGDFQDNQMEGIGIMTWANGDVYEGQFSRDMIWG